MANEAFRRPTQVTHAPDVIALVKRGFMDGNLDALAQAVTARKQHRRDAVDAMVREVYGPGATVVDGPGAANA